MAPTCDIGALPLRRAADGPRGKRPGSFVPVWFVACYRGQAMRATVALATSLLVACGDPAVDFGGAQDIGQFRDILEAGAIPGESTLDADGFMNEHLVELPPAGCDETLCVEAMLSVGRGWVWGDLRVALQVALTTPVDPATLTRPPLDVVVVVDTSSSMNDDEKLVRVKEALGLLVAGLAPGDRLGLVSYDREARVLFELAEPDAAAFAAAVDALAAEGSTDLYAGLELGLGRAAAAVVPDRQARVLLLSDGFATRGVIDPEAIVDMAVGYVAEGVALTTVGVGLDADVVLLRELAQHGAGNAYFAEDAAAVAEIFTEELDTFMTPLALDVELDVLPSAAYAITEAVGVPRWGEIPGGGRSWLPAVFLASRAAGTGSSGGGRRGGGSALFVLLAPSGAAPVDATVATVRMTYRLPGDTARREQTVAVSTTVPPGTTPEEAVVSHEAMRKSAAILEMFLGLRDAARMRCSHECALWVLAALDGATTRWLAATPDEDLAADLALVRRFVANLGGPRAGAAPEPAACRPYLDPSYCPGPDDACAVARPAGRRPRGTSLALAVAGVAAAALARRRGRAIVVAGGLALGAAACEELPPPAGASLVPVQVLGASDLRTLSAGYGYTCGTSEGGAAWCWGADFYSGVGSVRGEAPVAMALPPARSIAAGYDHGCAAAEDGSAWCFGGNRSGQLGDDTLRSRQAPVAVVDLAGVTAVASGGMTSCALVEDGSVWCWGENGGGALGDGTLVSRAVPVPVSGLGDAVAISMGGGRACALRADQTAWCWGWRGWDEEAAEALPPDVLPVRVEGLAGVTAISTAGRHGCAALADGSAWCWGENGDGQLGAGDRSDAAAPRRVRDLEGVVSVACGSAHSCAALADGTAWCWGYNGWGQLGDGTDEDRSAPVRVTGLTGVASVTAGQVHSCALMADGTAWCWGDGGSGELGDGIDRPSI